MWGFTLEEVRPYYDIIERDVLFREAVIGTLIDEKYSKENAEDDYCYACKLNNPNVDCSTCSKEISIERPSQEKAIGER